MAGDWIKVEHVTPDKPEIDLISESTGLHPDHVVGVLVRLWIWADQQTLSGNASRVTKNAIDRRAGVSGFADAMSNACWITETDDGLQFTNFDRHNSQTAKQRALTSKRVAKHKAKKGNDGSVSEALPREEKRREDKKENTKRKKSANYSAEFEEFWDACPNKVGKGHAWKAWPKALEWASNSPKRIEGESVAEFLTRRMRDYRAHVADKDAQFVRHPATWLNGGNWDDETGSRVPTDEDLKNWGKR